MKTKVWTTDESEPQDGLATNNNVTDYPPNWFECDDPALTADLYVLERWHCEAVGPVDVLVRDTDGALYKFSVQTRETIESTVKRIY